MNIIRNRVIRGMRGALDDFVYRKYGKRTIAGGRPDPRDTPPSPAQSRVQGRLTDGAAYAKYVGTVAALKAPYLARATATHNWSVLAIGDYLRPPEVTEVDITTYQGRIGDKVTIRARDDFEVVGVKVTIRDQTGAVLEQGPALWTGPTWIYTAQANAPVDQTLEIEAEASDRAGNQRTLSEMWHA